MFQFQHEFSSTVEHNIGVDDCGFGPSTTVDVAKQEAELEEAALVEWNNPFDDDEEEDDSDDDFTPLTEKLKRQREEKERKAEAEKNKDVLVLTTSRDNRLICVEGHFYRLDGKSLQSNTLRWKCFRFKDMQCSGRIYTESLKNDQQRFKPMRLDENSHNHKPYNEQQLRVLIKRNKMKIIQGAEKLLQTIGSQPTVPAKVQSISVAIDPMATAVYSRKKKKKVEFYAKKYRYVVDPKEVLNLHGGRGGNGIVKFSFLNSSKGKRILIVDDMIFYLDANGAVRERTYWACLNKRDKNIKCNCRIITEKYGNKEHIISVSGEHKHGNHRENIIRKLVKLEDNKGFTTISAAQEEDSCVDVNQKHQHNSQQILPLVIDAKQSVVQHANETPGCSSISNITINNSQFINNPDNIDPTNVLVLRSAKGRELLCLDGFIYHSKPFTTAKSIYWVCIKSKMEKCHARVTTTLNENNAIKVTRISNAHTHPVSEYDIKKRLLNEFAKSAEDKKKFKNTDIMQKPLSELNPQLAILLAKRMGTNPEAIAAVAPPTIVDSDKTIDFQSSFEKNFKVNRSEITVHELADLDSYGIEEQEVNNDDIMHDESSLDISDFLKMKTDIKPTKHDGDGEVSSSRRKSQRLTKDVKDIEYIEMQESEHNTTFDEIADEEYKPTITKRNSAGRHSKTNSQQDNDAEMYNFVRKRKIKQDLDYDYADDDDDDDDEGVRYSFKDDYDDDDNDANGFLKTEYDSANNSDGYATIATKKTGKKKRYAVKSIKSNPDGIDITNYIKLRSAKGNELLCLDGYLYNARPSAPNDRTYWSCIKAKDRLCKCLARVITATISDDELKVIHFKNSHTHPISEQDIRRRLCNDLPRPPGRVDLRKSHIENTPLSKLNPKLAALLEKRLSSEAKPKVALDIILYADPNTPQSLAVRMCLLALDMPYDLVDVTQLDSEQLPLDYARLNRHKDIPVLSDRGFFLSESTAIMQYLCDKNSPTQFYPSELKWRALVNHRLCFNMSFYYPSVIDYVMEAKRSNTSEPCSNIAWENLNKALQLFDSYLQRLGIKYAAHKDLTIADFALISTTICLEDIAFDLAEYPFVLKWYAKFEKSNSELWKLATASMKKNSICT